MSDVCQWIQERLKPSECNTDNFIYNHMESQSGYSLPVIYRPFDPTVKWHWTDRGSILDFLYSTNASGKKVLDFGPGDGWPSLNLASYADEVVGVDASKKLVSICKNNAERLGISNAKFVLYMAGSRLPFEDDSFDCATAASSIEQTPNPYNMLKEIHRVLRPGGAFRIHYEALEEYKNGHETDVWAFDIGGSSTRVIFYKRSIEQEKVLHYGITLDMSKEELTKTISKDGKEIGYTDFTYSFMEKNISRISDPQICTLTHPSGKTLAKWLREIGFSDVTPTHSGRRAAALLYESLAEKDRPTDMASVDKILEPVVKVAVTLEAPVQIDPMITAVKRAI